MVTNRKPRASARKPKPDPVARARAEAAMGAGAVDPVLAAMVTDYVQAFALSNASSNDPAADAAADAAFQSAGSLHARIAAFPAGSLADVCAKLPILRAELDVMVEHDRGANQCLNQATIRGLIADLERLSSDAAPGEVTSIAEAAGVPFEPIAELEAWRPPSDDDLDGLRSVLAHAVAVLRADKATLVAMFANDASGEATVSLMGVLDDNRDWLAGLTQMCAIAHTRLLVAGALACQAEGAAA